MSVENSPSVAPPGCASEASGSPSGAALVAELLSGIWFANFADRSKRRQARWLAPSDYAALMALCSELARDSDRSEVTELLENASDGEEAFAVWCYLIDDASASVQKRWVPALVACRHAIETPAEAPKPPFGGV